jgi:hypothetical protein
MDDNKVCERCKHWSWRVYLAPDDGKDWRECARTRHGFNHMFKDDDPSSLAIARSQRDVYQAALLTQPAFGCSQFED